MERIGMDLQLFADGAAAAAGAPGAGAEGNAAVTGAEPQAEDSRPIQAGDTLEGGQKVPDAQVAAELERQIKRHPELKKVYSRKPQGNQATGQAEEKPAETKTIQERWEEAKKGEFAEMYGNDVRKAVQDRFRNQEDAKAKLEETNAKLEALEPMLDLLRKRAGVNSNEELSNMLLNDDSLYEDAASEAGMTVESYKQFKAMERERDQLAARDEQAKQDRYVSSLRQQEAELKKVIPDFDLQQEMRNPQFRRLIRPEVGLSVQDAFKAIHFDELAPQLLQAGMERAQKQMGQTIQARGNRPAEGAMRGQGQMAARVDIDFRNMTRPQRDEFRRQIKSGKVVVPK